MQNLSLVMKGTRVLLSKKTFWEKTIKVPVTKHTIGMTLQTWFTGERKAPRVLGGVEGSTNKQQLCVQLLGVRVGNERCSKAPILPVN